MDAGALQTSQPNLSEQALGVTADQTAARRKFPRVQLRFRKEVSELGSVRKVFGTWIRVFQCAHRFMVVRFYQPTMCAVVCQFFCRFACHK
eukprot:2557678-Amphidinium_carterae.1